MGRKGAFEARSGDDLGGHPADAGAGQADGARRSGRKVENPAANERAPVIDGDDDAAAAMGDPELGAERQRAMGACHGVLIEVLARGGLAAGFVAVKGRHSRERATGVRRREDRGIGVTPARRAVGRVGHVVEMVMAVMMVPMGSGRSFGCTTPDQHSCGEKS